MNKLIPIIVVVVAVAAVGGYLLFANKNAELPEINEEVNSEPATTADGKTTCAYFNGYGDDFKNGQDKLPGWLSVIKNGNTLCGTYEQLTGTINVETAYYTTNMSTEELLNMYRAGISAHGCEASAISTTEYAPDSTYIYYSCRPGTGEVSISTKLPGIYSVSYRLISVQ
ncbi:MAG: hypothetical protein PHP03_01815 [Candidatus Pacebacteria bacterium]|nr:hypothetical protein [Candidatus Paceibacterota bacterium]